MKGDVDMKKILLAVLALVFLTSCITVYVTKEEWDKVRAENKEPCVKVENAVK